MEIIKSKSGKPSYRETVYINGKRERKSFRRASDARSWKQRRESDRDRSIALGISPNKEINYSDFLKLWNERKFNAIAVTTKRRYLGIQKLYLDPYFIGLNLRQIDKEKVHDFASHLRSNEVPVQTIDQTMRLLKTMLGSAVEWDYLKTNPVSKFPLYAKKIKRECYWEESEAVFFLEATKSHPLHTLFLLAIKLGLRRGELAGLKWDVVNFSTNHITICRIRDRFGERQVTKTLEKREIPMNSEIHRTMKALYAARNSDFVFSRADGSPIDIQHVYRAFNNAQRDVGMQKQICFHDLRHSFASIFLMRGGNINALSKIMGHSQITMTERYGHIASSHVKSEMEKMCSEPENRKAGPYLAHENLG